jgi:hypothetical protein
MIKRFIQILLLFLLFILPVFPQGKILIPMDLTQTDHLKAYGITFNALVAGLKADWLLNYRGGSFMIQKKLFLTVYLKKYFLSK